ncbi:hypothetical protein EON82_16280, partial [bacterium]
MGRRRTNEPKEETVADIHPERGSVFTRQTWKKDSKGKIKLGPDGNKLPEALIWYGEAPAAGTTAKGKPKKVYASAPALHDEDAVGKRKCVDELNRKIKEADDLETLRQHGLDVEAGESLDAALQRLADVRAGRVVKKATKPLTLEEYFDQRFLLSAPLRSRKWYIERFNNSIRPYKLARTPIHLISSTTLEAWYTNELSKQEKVRAYWKGGEKIVEKLGEPIKPRTRLHATAIIENILSRALGDLDQETGEPYVKTNAGAAARYQHDLTETDKSE